MLCERDEAVARKMKTSSYEQDPKGASKGLVTRWLTVKPTFLCTVVGGALQVVEVAFLPLRNTGDTKV